jgi:uncharacterized membrane protein
VAFNLRNRSFVKEIDFEPRELRFLFQLSEALEIASARRPSRPSSRVDVNTLDAPAGAGQAAQTNERQEDDHMAKQVVLAIFPNEAAADTAAQSLKDWDKLDDDVKLHAIGVLVLDDKGKIKTHKLGRRSWGKGAGIGVVLAALTPPTLIAGAVAGGALGALHHKGLGIDSAERDQIAAALQDGRAAVGTLVADGEAQAVSDKLGELGGELHVLSPSDEAVAEVDAVAPEVDAAIAAEGSEQSPS